MNGTVPGAVVGAILVPEREGKVRGCGERERGERRGERREKKEKRENRKRREREEKREERREKRRDSLTNSRGRDR